VQGQAGLKLQKDGKTYSAFRDPGKEHRHIIGNKKYEEILHPSCKRKEAEKNA